MGSTGEFIPLAHTALFKPVELGALKLEHRLVLSPLTRMRGTKESDGVWAPTDLNVEYYSQRASKGGFMLTEATPISRLVSVSK
jgi:2,4-dienoyl-CoA reductase-like NADH-dependent reductase (Old Yellow Enzyme family)